LGQYQWHYPNSRGFDYQFGCYGSGTLYGPAEVSEDLVNYRHKSYSTDYQWKKGRDEDAAILENNHRIKNFKEYLTFAIRDKSIEFIKQHQGQPFFLYVPFTAPHEPYQALLDYYCNQSNAPDKGTAVYRAIIRALDDAVGALNQAVKDLGLEENTQIIFLSDNGPALYTGVAEAGEYKGGKLTTFEGGINVPFIWKWKNIFPAGSSYDPPISALDIFPTCVAAAGAQLPKDRIYDGVDLLPFITGKSAEGPHPILYWKADHVCTIRKGQYKLIWSTRDKWLELYDLAADHAEKNNLAAQLPEKVKELQQDFENWNSTMPAKPMWPRIMDYRCVIHGKEYLFPA
jgi:arylsulfatase A-like enzyme